MLREQGGGIVMQFSSMGGRVGGSPGIASYQAAKFAIDGFSRVLAAETAPFGVRVIVVEPSGFKTDWAGSSMIIRDIPEAYAGTVGAINRRVRQNPAGRGLVIPRARPRSWSRWPSAATSLERAVRRRPCYLPDRPRDSLLEQACGQERPVVDLPEDLLLAGVVLHDMLSGRVGRGRGLVLDGGVAVALRGVAP